MALNEPGSVYEPHDYTKAGIIFLLSDGDTNQGETNWHRIRKNTVRKNNERFAIFNFAIGDYAPFEDLEKLSIQNNGVARQIIEDSDVEGRD